MSEAARARFFFCDNDKSRVRAAAFALSIIGRSLIILLLLNSNFYDVACVNRESGLNRF